MRPSRSPSPVPGGEPWLNPDLPPQVPRKRTPAKRAKNDVKPGRLSSSRKVRPARVPTKVQRPARKANPVVSGEGVRKHKTQKPTLKTTPIVSSNETDAARSCNSTTSTTTHSTIPPMPERHFVARPGRAPLLVPSPFGPPPEPNHAHLFLGRTCCPPFVFATYAPLSAPASNARWARDGEIAETEYHIEVGAGRVFAAGRVGELAQAACQGNDKKRKAVYDVEREEKRNDTTLLPEAHDTAFEPPAFRSSRTWTGAQTRAMWVTQLTCGEGKNWAAVQAAVDAAGGAKTRDVSRSLWRC